MYRCELAVTHLAMWTAVLQWSVRNTDRATNQTKPAPHAAKHLDCSSKAKQQSFPRECPDWGIDPFEFESFVLVTADRWSRSLSCQAIGWKVEKWCKLGCAAWVFTRGLSHQIKPGAHRWFTSCHFVVRVAGARIKHNQWRALLVSPARHTGRGP